MNKFISTLISAITIFVTGCQAAMPAQLNVQNAEISYAVEETQSNTGSEIRSLDGSNNNTANPNWGSVNQHLLRLAPADYGDGLSTPA